jgi:hypothetical protein
VHDPALVGLLARAQHEWVTHCADGRTSGLSTFVWIVPDPAEERLPRDPALCPLREVWIGLATCDMPPARAAWRLAPRCGAELDPQHDWDADWLAQPAQPEGNMIGHPVPWQIPVPVALRGFEDGPQGRVEIREIVKVDLHSIERTEVARTLLPASSAPWLPWRGAAEDADRLEAELRAPEEQRTHRIYGQRRTRVSDRLREASCPRWRQLMADQSADWRAAAIGWPPIERGPAEAFELRIWDFPSEEHIVASPPLRIVAGGSGVRGEIASRRNEVLAPPGLGASSWDAVLAALEASGLFELRPPHEAATAAWNCDGLLGGLLIETRRDGAVERRLYPGWRSREGERPAGGTVWELTRDLREAVLRALMEAGIAPF